MKETIEVFESIFSNANYFGHWFVLVILLIVAVFSAVIFTLWKFKNAHWAMLGSLVLGFILLALLLVMKNNSTAEAGATEFTSNLLHLPGLIFISLVLVVVPFFLVLVVASLVFNSNFKEVKKSTYGVSFASLFGLSIMGILIALLMTPLILLIPDSIWPAHDVASPTHGSTDSPADYTWAIVLGLIWTTFIVCLVIKFIMKDNITKLASGAEFGVNILTRYFKMLVLSVPYILMFRIGSFGLNANPGHDITFMFVYLGIFWLGVTIITTVLNSLIILLSDKNKSVKQKLTITWTQWLNVFGIQSTSASLPLTMETTENLGVCKEISNITPRKGVFMGMIMCNGFTPMLIVIFAMVYEDMFTIWNVLLAITIILTLSFSTSGAGSADYIITMTTLSTIGIPNHIYFDHLLWSNEINEMTITKPTNNLGHIVATLITERHHINQRECCDHNCKHNHSNDELDKN